MSRSRWTAPSLACLPYLFITLAAAVTGRQHHRNAGRSTSSAGFNTSATNSTITELRPIVFIKTHKTGSTSLSNIVFRLGESRNKTFMLNCSRSKCSGHLGWPRSFPPKEAADMWGPPAHQFDIICNHAVYNDERMRKYLRDAPFAFTILREPMARLESAFDYYPSYISASWDDRLRKLENLDSNSRAAFRLRNSQAHDLGWHDWAGGTSNDGRDDLIKDWIWSLDQNLSFVMLTEHFDEGLVLLRRKLALNPSDVRYLRVDPRGAASRRYALHATVATSRGATLGAPQAAAVARHMRVDTLLYSHFNQSFWHEWEAAGGWDTLGSEVEELRARNEALAKDCSDHTCSWRFQADDTQYPSALRHVATWLRE